MKQIVPEGPVLAMGQGCSPGNLPASAMRLTRSDPTSEKFHLKSAVWYLASPSSCCHWAAALCLHSLMGTKFLISSLKGKFFLFIFLQILGGFVPNFLLPSLVCTSTHRMPRQSAFNCLNYAISPCYFSSQIIARIWYWINTQSLDTTELAVFLLISPGFGSSL